jgi:hypothetical protein
MRISTPRVEQHEHAKSLLPHKSGIAAGNGLVLHFHFILIIWKFGNVYNIRIIIFKRNHLSRPVALPTGLAADCPHHEPAALAGKHSRVVNELEQLPAHIFIIGDRNHRESADTVMVQAKSHRGQICEKAPYSLPRRRIRPCPLAKVPCAEGKHSLQRFNIAVRKTKKSSA